MIRLTPKEVAQRYRCKPSKVIGWIRSGELEAINIGDGSTKPRFLISEDALKAFEAKRTARTAPHQSPHRRRRPDGQVRRFF